MSHKRVIITVLNTIGPTSMPLNEFILYRAERYPDEENCVIILGPTDTDFIEQNKEQWSQVNVKVLYCQASYFKLRNALNKTLADSKAKGEKPIVHLHHPRAGAAVLMLNLLFLRKVPVLVTIHSQVTRYPWSSRLMWLVSFILADCITFVSHSACKVFSPFLRKIRKSKVHVVVNGVDLNRVDESVNKCVSEDHAGNDDLSDKKASKDHLKLLNVGSLVKAKNQMWLLELLAKLPENVTLKIVGEGGLRSQLESRAKELGITHRLTLAGLVPREQVYRELITADLLVSPSLWEGLPIAILEAMAIKCPMLLSDIGSHVEIENNGKRAKTLPLQFDEWVKEVKGFMLMDRQQREAIGDINREIVESNFTLDKMHEKYTQLYESLEAVY